MWYYVQPLMGLVLGAITFLIIAGGFLIVQVNITDPNAAAGARLIPYLVAVLAGFKQDFVYDQLGASRVHLRPRAGKGGVRRSRASARAQRNRVSARDPVFSWSAIRPR